MIICVCHRVSHHDIQRAVRGGCASFGALQQDLRVATQCGRCRDCAKDSFDAARCAAGNPGPVQTRLGDVVPA